MAARRMVTIRAGWADAAGDHDPPARSQMSVHGSVPVWVQRMHADGLPAMAGSPRTALSAGSRWAIDRWSRVATGY